MSLSEGVAQQGMAHSCMSSSIGSLIDSLNHWFMVSWFIDSLVHGFIDSVRRWFLDSLVVQFVLLQWSLIHWFIASLLHWLVDSYLECFISSLVHWSTVWFVHWFIDSLTFHRLIGSLVHWLFIVSLVHCFFAFHWFIWFMGSLIHGFTASLIRRFIDSLFHWFINSLTHSLTHSLIHWLTHSLNHGFVASLTHCFLDLLVHVFIGSFSQLCMDSFMSFHWHLKHHLLFRWCTAQLQHFSASASKKLSYRPMISYSQSYFFRNFRPGTGHYLVTRDITSHLVCGMGHQGWWIPSAGLVKSLVSA